MKKFLLLLVMSVSVMTLSSCEEKETGKEYKLQVSAEPLEFAAENATAKDIDVIATNVVWDIELGDETATWLHLVNPKIN